MCKKCACISAIGAYQSVWLSLLTTRRVLPCHFVRYFLIGVLYCLIFILTGTRAECAINLFVRGSLTCFCAKNVFHNISFHSTVRVIFSRMLCWKESCFSKHILPKMQRNKFFKGRSFVCARAETPPESLLVWSNEACVAEASSVPRRLSPHLPPCLSFCVVPPLRLPHWTVIKMFSRDVVFDST